MLVPILTLLSCHLVASTLPYMQIDPGDPATYRFGYDIGHVAGAPRLLREETKQPDGSVIGRYGYTDPYGNFREVRYIAGENGFIITHDKTVPDPSKDVSVLLQQPDDQTKKPGDSQAKIQSKSPVYSHQEHLAEKAIPEAHLSSGLPFASFIDGPIVPRPPFYQPTEYISQKPDNSESFIASGLPFASFHPSELNQDGYFNDKRIVKETSKTTEQAEASTTPSPSPSPSSSPSPSPSSSPKPTSEVVISDGAVEYHPYDYVSGKPALPEVFLSSGLPFASSAESVKSGHLNPPSPSNSKEENLHYHQAGEITSHRETPESIIASSLPFASFGVKDRHQEEKPKDPVQSSKIQPYDHIAGKPVVPESFLASGLPFASTISEGKQVHHDAPLYHASEHLAQKQVLPTELLAAGLPFASFSDSESKLEQKKPHQSYLTDDEVPEALLASSLPFASLDVQNPQSPDFYRRLNNNHRPTIPHEADIPDSYLASGLPFASFHPAERGSLGEAQSGSGSVQRPHQQGSSLSRPSTSSDSHRGSQPSRIPSRSPSGRRYSHSVLPYRPYQFRYPASPFRRMGLIELPPPEIMSHPSWMADGTRTARTGFDSAEEQTSQSEHKPEEPAEQDQEQNDGATFVSIAEDQKQDKIGEQISVDPAQPTKSEHTL